jgi:hypothetical protein
MYEAQPEHSHSTQTYCKRCLCDKHKELRQKKKRQKTGHEELAGSVAFAADVHAAAGDVDQPDGHLSSPIDASQMHSVAPGFPLQASSFYFYFLLASCFPLSGGLQHALIVHDRFLPWLLGAL